MIRRSKVNTSLTKRIHRCLCFLDSKPKKPSIMEILIHWGIKATFIYVTSGRLTDVQKTGVKCEGCLWSASLQSFPFFRIVKYNVAVKGIDPIYHEGSNLTATPTKVRLARSSCYKPVKTSLWKLCNDFILFFKPAMQQKRHHFLHIQTHVVNRRSRSILVYCILLCIWLTAVPVVPNDLLWKLTDSLLELPCIAHAEDDILLYR